MRRPLRWRSVSDALVIPIMSVSDNSAGAGVVRSHGAGFDYVRGTGLRRYSREIIPRPQTHDLVVNQSLSQAIFGGFLFNHFGHFLLESLSRVWIELAQEIDDSVPLVWIAGTGAALSPRRDRSDDITTWMKEIFRQIGLNREVMIIDNSTGALGVKELLVPQASCELREWIHPDQLRRLGTTPWRPSRAETKVWLSRTGIGTKSGGLVEEVELEHALADCGWTIVRSEDLAVADQVEVLASASHVAGVEGSALHGLVLVGGFGGTIDIIRRHSNPNFKVVALAGGWNQRMFDPVGGRITLAPVKNSLTGELVAVPTWEGIDVRATARAIDESSGRAVTN